MRFLCTFISNGNILYVISLISMESEMINFEYHTISMIHTVNVEEPLSNVYSEILIQGNLLHNKWIYLFINMVLQILISSMRKLLFLNVCIQWSIKYDHYLLLINQTNLCSNIYTQIGKYSCVLFAQFDKYCLSHCLRLKENKNSYLLPSPWNRSDITGKREL